MEKEKLKGLIKNISDTSSKAIVLMIYSKMFKKQNRPNYDTYPGIYCIDRVKEKIDREVIKFNSGNLKLTGYIYNAKKPKGLVVFSHGLHAGADDYIPIFLYLLKNNYSVFSYDYKGVYESEGKNMVGMSESLVDLDSALNYVENNEAFKKLPKFLMGHSWGGFATCSVLCIHKNIKACASIAGFNDGSKMFLEKAEQFAPKEFVSIPAPTLEAYQKILFGDYLNYNATKGINSVNIPILLAHGKTDKTINYSLQSVVCHRSEFTNKKVVFYDGLGIQGDHNYIWHSVESGMYQNKIREELKMIEKSMKRKLTDDELKEYYKNVDHNLYSELNLELFEKIINMFDKEI